MNVTVTINDPAKVQALLKWLWQNQLLEKTTIDKSPGLRENEEDKDDFWMNVSSETLRDLWDAPEEDYWDQLYAERHGKPKDCA